MLVRFCSRTFCNHKLSYASIGSKIHMLQIFCYPSVSTSDIKCNPIIICQRHGMTNAKPKSMKI